jgi:hypothetical protein
LKEAPLAKAPAFRLKTKKKERKPGGPTVRMSGKTGLASQY